MGIPGFFHCFYLSNTPPLCLLQPAALKQGTCITAQPSVSLTERRLNGCLKPTDEYLRSLGWQRAAIRFSLRSKRQEMKGNGTHNVVTFGSEREDEEVYAVRLN